jgi:Ulp1 family protease
MNKCTKNIDLFKTDLVLWPINVGLHHSLAVILYPCSLLDQWLHGEDSVAKKQTRILHLNSLPGLRAHNSKKISEHLKKYILATWIDWPKRKEFVHLSAADRNSVETGHPNIIAKIRAIKPITVPVPQQKDGWSCGINTYRYAQAIMDTPLPCTLPATKQVSYLPAGFPELQINPLAELDQYAFWIKR